MKILMVLTSKFHHSGITMVVLNYYKELIKKENCYIDFVIPNEIEDDLKEQLDLTKTNLFVLPMSMRRKHIFKYMKKLKEIMKNGGYDVVHVHGSSSIMFFELLTAKKANIKVRIAHSHNTKTEHVFIHKLLYPFFSKSYTHALACSEVAGKWLFKNNKFIILDNGFNVLKFKYNEDERKKIRKSLKLSDEDIVLGHIGLFNNQKNQSYLIDVLKKLENDNYKLLLVGKGKLQKTVEKYALDNNIEKKVIFFGETSNPEKLYSVFDIFLMPSRFEGLGLVALEAQISGLPCILSDKVPRVVKINENVHFLPIEKENIKNWMYEITNIDILNRNNSFENITKKFAKYDIKKCSEKLFNIYKESCNDF